MRVDEIARHLNTAFEGAGDLEITGAARLEQPALAKSPSSAKPQGAAKSRPIARGLPARRQRFPSRPHADPRQRSPRQPGNRDRSSLSAASHHSWHPSQRGDRSGCRDRTRRPQSGPMRLSARSPHRRAHVHRRWMRHRRSGANRRGLPAAPARHHLRQRQHRRSRHAALRLRARRRRLRVRAGTRTATKNSRRSDASRSATMSRSAQIHASIARPWASRASATASSSTTWCTSATTAASGSMS